MYVIPIGVPLFTEGDRYFVQSDWRRAIELLRDSLAGRYGDLLLISPWLPMDDPRAGEQPLERLDLVEGVRAMAAYNGHIRARWFWTRELRSLRRIYDEAFQTAQVVHAGLDDLFRPMMGLGFAMASKRRIPTVFVQDTDVVVQAPALAGSALTDQAKVRAYVFAHERVCREGVRRADLSLLKSGTLEQRYARFARNLLVFEDTSYRASEIVGLEKIEARLATLESGRPLRFVYCGRLVARKGVDVSVRLLARARALGARVELEIIGSGPEEAAIAALVDELGVQGVVHLAGAATYGPELIERLASFDGLLFTPTAEDTPRMIFDGYAASLPLIATPIPYVEQRARAEHATELLPTDPDEAAEALLALDRCRGRLAELARRAEEAAVHHSADAWYARRAARTHEAVERRRRENSR